MYMNHKVNTHDSSDDIAEITKTYSFTIDFVLKTFF